MAVKIVALGGSFAQQSTSLAAVRIALEGAADTGAQVELFDVRQLDLPIYVPQSADVPERARTFCESVYAADGMLWSSPLYHGTISGSFKNTLD
jgi:FMN reductase